MKRKQIARRLKVTDEELDIVDITSTIHFLILVTTTWRRKRYTTPRLIPCPELIGWEFGDRPKKYVGKGFLGWA